MVFWRKKSIVVEIIIVAAVLSVIALMSFPQTDEHQISQIVCSGDDGLAHNDCAIFVDAIYESSNNVVKITYSDNSKMTSLVVLEILGMEETFHKKFSDQSFVEIIKFDSVPKYGWATMPVTFFLEHEAFGLVGLKTEIHLNDEPKPKVIYSEISDSDWSKLVSLKLES